VPFTIKQITVEDTWPIRHRVMWPDQPFDFVKVPDDQNGQHFGLFEADQLITVVSLFINEDTVQFRKLATEVAHQGKGYGTTIMTYVIDWSRQKGCRNIWCNARADKTPFYQKFGMQETNQTFEKGGIDFVVMDMTL
jgi:predicted GNAT family N-acyltransferase